MEEMGMTDKQFNAFIRLLLEDINELKELEEVADKEKKMQKLEKIAGFLQKTLED